MSRLLTNSLVFIFSAALSACGGSGGSSSPPSTCTGTTLPVSLTYASAVVTQNSAATLTPTVTGIPSGCDASKISYTAAPLPAGMTIATKTGVISGTPTALGATSPVVTVAVTGYSGTATASSFTVTVQVSPVAWTTKATAHGIANLVTTHLLTVGTDLYLLGSQSLGSNYAPVLYKSSDSGATWTNTGTPPNFTSLIHFSATSDGANLYLAGGRTSDATVIAASSYTYNDDVWKFTPAGSAGSWTKQSTSPFKNLSGSNIGGAELSAMAYDTSIGGTMYVTSGDRKGIIFAIAHKSTNYGASWSALSNAPQQAGHCLAIDSAGALHSLGGYGVSGASFANLTSDFVSVNGGASWTEKSSTALASPYQMSCGFIGSTLYAVGGTTKGATSAVGSVRRILDGGTTWTVDTTSATFATRAKAGMAVLASKLLVFGGSSNGTNTLTDVLEGTP